jgi:hypothetical protein
MSLDVDERRNDFFFHWDSGILLFSCDGDGDIDKKAGMEGMRWLSS